MTAIIPFFRSETQMSNGGKATVWMDDNWDIVGCSNADFIHAKENNPHNEFQFQEINLWKISDTNNLISVIFRNIGKFFLSASGRRIEDRKLRIPRQNLAGKREEAKVENFNEKIKKEDEDEVTEKKFDGFGKELEKQNLEYEERKKVENAISLPDEVSKNKFFISKLNQKEKSLFRSCDFRSNKTKTDRFLSERRLRGVL